MKWYEDPDYPPGRASRLLTGNLDETGSGYILTLQLVENNSGFLVSEWDFLLDRAGVEDLLTPSVMAGSAATDASEPNK